MRKDSLVLWGTFSLGLHIMLLWFFPGPVSNPVKGPIFTEVGIVALSKPAVAQKTRGDNAVSASPARSVSPALPEKKESKKEPLLKPQKHSAKVPGALPPRAASTPQEFSPSVSQKVPVPDRPSTTLSPESSMPQVDEASLEDVPVIRAAVGDASAEQVAYAPSEERAESSSAGTSPEVPLAEASPAYAENPKPSYPRLAKQRGWEGKVALKVRVSPEGDVLDIEIEQSSGYSILDWAALKAVKRWHFRPARRGETPVMGEVIVPVEFRLQKI